MTALLLTLALGAPAEIGGKDDKAEKAAKAELEKLQGVWKLTDRELRGRAYKGTPLDTYTLVVIGDAYVFTTHAGTLKVDPAKKTVDLTVTDGPYKGTTLPGIYELSDGGLKIAIHAPTTRGAERPKDLKSELGTSHTLYTFAKDAKATKDDAQTKMKELKERVATRVGPSEGFPARSGESTQELLKKVMDKLDAIDKRLDAIEKRLPPADKK